ncbi:MAG: hypothetical protein HJJLKODD_00317 [Phycisphaerae bacterium]|nr:hypothetical protein [Phycisphaerae bacterium]
MKSKYIFLSCAFIFLPFAAISQGEDQHKNPPASVSNGVPENKLTLITLTPEAVQRLKIEVRPVEMKPMQRTRLLGGEVMIPPGQSAMLVAPVAGVLLAGDIPSIGQQVKKDQILFRLVPVLSSERLGLLQAQADIIDAQGQVAHAQVRADAAQVKVERADKLKEENAGSVKAAEEARAELDLARADLNSAQSRLQVLKSSMDATAADSATVIELKSPLDGILQSLPACPGQVVATGISVAEVINTDRMWIRVPVYAGDSKHFNFQNGVSIQKLGSDINTILGNAKQISGPLTANFNASTINVYFELDNSQAQLRPGESVGAIIPTLTEKTSLVVPWSAIVFDIYGNSWVYEVIGANQYSRSRIEIEYVLNDQAVLSRGPKPNTQVVTIGAAELFGTEFGVGH